MKRGFTLHEMLISLAVMGGVLGICAHLSLEQLRFFRGVRASAEGQAQLGQANAILANLLWSLSPGSGDVAVAQDTALEIWMPTGVSVACGAEPGRLLVAAPAPQLGNTLGSFVSMPAPGDRMAVLFHDSLGTTWLSVRLTASAVAAGGCPAFPVSSAWAIPLMETPPLPAGAALRFSRPLRLSFYRASDARWYLGAKDWNAASGVFNAIQPVAGPFRARSSDPAETGFAFHYKDRLGEDLPEPVDASRIATIVVTTRALATVPGSSNRQDSATTIIALRNSR